MLSKIEIWVACSLSSLDNGCLARPSFVRILSSQFIVIILGLLSGVLKRIIGNEVEGRGCNIWHLHDSDDQMISTEIPLARKAGWMSPNKDLDRVTTVCEDQNLSLARVNVLSSDRRQSQDVVRCKSTSGSNCRCVRARATAVYDTDTGGGETGAGLYSRKFEPKTKTKTSDKKPKRILLAINLLHW